MGEHFRFEGGSGMAPSGHGLIRRDPVRSQVRAAVLLRDGKCVARRLGATTPCKDVWGNPDPSANQLQLDHVKDQPAIAMRAPSDQFHLVAICPFHHLEGWATSHRPLLRRYLHYVANHRASQAADLAMAEFRV